jgi:excisionase family DNA binding protein
MTIALEEAVAPTTAESELAKDSGRQLSPFQKKNLRVKIANDSKGDQMIELPASAVRLLVRILREMAEGNAVTLMPIRAELTTQQAAQLLGVSRPFLIRLLESGKLPHRKVGTHRRILFQDLLRYEQSIDAARAKTLDDLAAQAQEFKLGY